MMSSIAESSKALDLKMKESGVSMFAWEDTGMLKDAEMEDGGNLEETGMLEDKKATFKYVPHIKHW